MCIIIPYSVYYAMLLAVWVNNKTFLVKSDKKQKIFLLKNKEVSHGVQTIDADDFIHESFGGWL